MIINLLLSVSVTTCIAIQSINITTEQLEIQSNIVAGALLQYNIENDSLKNMYTQQNTAYTKWKLYEAMAVLFYNGGAYDRGAYYHTVALVEEIEYNRLTVLITTTKLSVETKWYTYLKEFKKLQTMLKTYKGS